MDTRARRTAKARARIRAWAKVDTKHVFTATSTPKREGNNWTLVWVVLAVVVIAMCAHAGRNSPDPYPQCNRYLDAEHCPQPDPESY